MVVCHAQHLATKYQSQGHNFGEKSFSEYDYVLYQIKGNEMYDIVQAKISPLHAPATPRVGSKGQNIFFLLKMVMLHIE